MHFNLSAAKLFRETTKLEAGTCRPKTIRGRLSCYVFCICCKYQKYKPAESIKNNQGRGTFKLMRNLKLPTKKSWNMSTKNILCRPKTIREGSPLKLFSSIWRWRDKRIRFGNFMNWTNQFRQIQSTRIPNHCQKFEVFEPKGCFWFKSYFIFTTTKNAPSK